MLELGNNTVVANIDSERFQTGADKYAAYLETPPGRLRLDLAFANVQEFLPPVTECLRALDLGCGTGAIAVRLARLGIYVTLFDSSSSMLGFAERAAREAGVTDRITLRFDDIAHLTRLGCDTLFDIVLCHNILEYVDDPGAVLRSAARLLRGPSATCSILVRNQAGEVLRAAIQDGDFTAAEHNLTADWASESLYGGRVRLFTPESLQSLLTTVPLTVIAERGVRVVSDYLPALVARAAEYERMLALERELGRRPQFAAVARYSQYLTRRSNAAGVP